MSKFFIAAFILSSLVATIIACKTQKTAQTNEKKTNTKTIMPEKSFYQTWLHSREEDKEAIKNYRPADGSFQFPPSRGRYGWVFEKEGKGGITYPGPTDATEIKPFTWTITQQGDNRILEIVVQDATKNYTEKYKIIALDAKILQVELLK